MTQIFKFNKAIQFVFILGLISLFSDMTYEAARSINGPFLKTLGTNGTIIGLIAGLGELIGYGLRFISGYIADKTKKYWLNPPSSTDSSPPPIYSFMIFS